MHFNQVSSGETAEIIEVFFGDPIADDAPYLLISRGFEFFDDGTCTVETHDEEYRGYFLLSDVLLERNRLLLQLPRPEANKIEVTFVASDWQFAKLHWALKSIVQSLRVNK